MHGKARSQVTPHAHWIAARAEVAVDGGFGLNRYSFGRDRLSTNVRFASIPTVNSGLWDLSRCANNRHLIRGVALPLPPSKRVM